ncbi:DUF2177 family protein [Candidatus Woesearchaeota archaeon]|nr:DUF2177 family protein [Candidatus Woesearchaeota archaeon]
MNVYFDFRVLIAIIVLILVDYIFLRKIMASFYKKELGALARKKGNVLNPRLLPSFIVYFLMVVGIAIFVLPLIIGQSAIISFIWGAAFGFILYGVYDLTNYAIIKKWSLKLTIVDICWGAILCGIISFLLHFIIR